MCMVASCFPSALRLGRKPACMHPPSAVQIREEGASGDAEVVTASGEVLRCDAVVITVPLGVLKVGGRN